MLKPITYIASLAIASAIISSCASNAGSSSDVAFKGPFLQYDSVWANSGKYSEKVEIKYAKGLKVEYRKDGIHVFISNPDPNVKNAKTEEIVINENHSVQSSSAASLNSGNENHSVQSSSAASLNSGNENRSVQSSSAALLNNSNENDNKDPQNGKKRFICTTALQLGNFEVLGMEDRIVGMNSLKNVFSPKIKQQLSEGSTVKVGKEGNFDLEAVIATRPDYIFVSASKYGGFETLKECGIPLIPHHGYKETHPLGQVEWIKLIGLLTGEVRRANAVFADVEAKYMEIKNKVAKVTHNKKLPTILSGRQIRDGWYVMGGKSYMARIFADAGAEYIMKNTNEAGGVTLDFETVYARGINADFWQTDGTFDDEFTLSDLETEDARYADIAAFKNKHVLFCNFAQTPYRELGGLEPHILLSDFVKAFHPEILPQYAPKYYKVLE